MLITKHHNYIRRKYVTGRLNIGQAARRLGYKGSSMQKGMAHIRDIMKDMGITFV